MKKVAILAVGLIVVLGAAGCPLSQGPMVGDWNITNTQELWGTSGIDGTMSFLSDGTGEMVLTYQGQSDSVSYDWVYDRQTKTLTLTFSGNEENFDVVYTGMFRPSQVTITSEFDYDIDLERL